MGNKLALFGGEKSITTEDSSDIFKWPIVTSEHEKAVLDVLRAGNMSGFDITREFEKQYAKELGMKYALACNNGTAAIHCGFYGLGIGAGDEVICPSLTYWASVAQVYTLGATPIFADVDPETLCINPEDVEKCITPRTKLIVVVHYAGVPADMDSIMALAKKHNIKIFEDCSHAHAALYKGREVGTFGDVSGFSLMSGKSFAIGEGGIMFTNDRRVYERALLFGHYARHSEIELDDLKEFTGLPCGGYKYRMHQLSSAFGLVQLKHYRNQFKEIDEAMNYFCDMIDHVPGIKSHRPHKNSGSTKGGWYYPLAHFIPEELGGLSVRRFSEAVCAEGGICGIGCNKPLHLHPLFTKMDVYGHHKPTRILNFTENSNLIYRDLPVTENVNDRICSIPWFKHYRPEIIKQYANAYVKVAENYKQLLEGDKKIREMGQYSSSFRKK
ncbi:MAG TPA: hypothetical protein DDX75_01850 [Phycisphaerales bacterium]|nr:hypothetical protein [Phycisphaerales bacterium]